MNQKIRQCNNWNTTYLPAMLIGSATMVTYRSDNARLPMKMHSKEFIFFDLQRATRMSRFPNAPTSEASIRTTNRQEPTAGDSAMNSNRLKTLPAGLWSVVTFILRFKFICYNMQF